MTNVANETRGEMIITLDADYVLRPSYEAIEAIESQLATGILDLCRRAGNQSMTLREATVIVTECIRAQGRERNLASLMHSQPDTVRDMIIEAPGGLLIAIKIIEMLLFRASSGGYTSKGEPKPLTTTEAASVATTDAE